MLFYPIFCCFPGGLLETIDNTTHIMYVLVLMSTFFIGITLVIA